MGYKKKGDTKKKGAQYLVLIIREDFSSLIIKLSKMLSYLQYNLVYLMLSLP